MFHPLKDYKKTIIILVVALVSVAAVGVSPGLRHVLKTHRPFKAPYLMYSKWKYNWRSPSDMGDGNNAREIIIEGPMGIGEDSQGNLYFSDRDARFLWKIEPSGRATVIGGTGFSTGPKQFPRQRLPARDVAFDSPEGLVVEPDGNVLFVDSSNQVVLRIDPEGYVTRFAGTGEQGYNGDGKPATETSFGKPYDIRTDSKGAIYIADTFNHRIRKIDGNGIVSTVAGNGVAGYSGDGGPAIAAQLRTPYGIYFDKDDNLLIADSENHVIRKVGRDGIIHTIAGSGQRGYDGDGGPALKATFDTPQSLAVDAAGRVYIGDEHNNAIRVLELDGTIRTLVGSKGPGFSGDGGPASQAQIADPENMWIRKDGSILISARDNARLRIVTPDGIINTFAGRGPTRKHDYYAPIHLEPIDP